MVMVWILALWNFAIGCWNSYASGQMWEMSDGKFMKALAFSGGAMGFIGIMYAIVLAGIGLGYVGQEFLLATNVVLGAPAIVFGLIITIDSILVAIKRKSFWSVIIAIYNTVATAWNIFVWIQSLKEMGGFGEAVGELTDEDSRLAIIVAAFSALLLSYALFQYGKKQAREKYSGQKVSKEDRYPF